MLIEIRDFVRERQQVSPSQVANHFDISETVAEAACDLLTRQKLLDKLSAGCAGSCVGCAPAPEYVWRQKPIFFDFKPKV